MSDDFRGWLTKEINLRKWSKSELARKSDLSQSIISKMLLGSRNVTADQCIKIAQALDVSPEKLLRLANILPSTVSDNATVQEITDIARQLPPDIQEEILEFVRFKLNQNNR